MSIDVIGTYKTILIEPWSESASNGQVQRVKGRPKHPSLDAVHNSIRGSSQWAPDAGGTHLYVLTPGKLVAESIKLVEYLGFRYANIIHFDKSFEVVGKRTGDRELFCVIATLGKIKPPKLRFNAFKLSNVYVSDLESGPFLASFHSLVVAVSPAPRIELFVEHQLDGFCGGRQDELGFTNDSESSAEELVSD